MKFPFLALLVVASSGFAADSIDAPAVKAGDSWVYRSTTERGASWNQTRDEVTVTRATASTIFFTVKASGSTQPPKELFFGRDWSRVRDVNGKETLVNQPLAFPLSIGKAWRVEYEERKPTPAHRMEHFESRYVVVGYEDVQVPAGTFRALKIESEGNWRAELEPGQSVVQGARSSEGGATAVTQVQKIEAREASGRTYKAFWYVPEVRRWVKSVEEFYGSDGSRNERFTQELESFRKAE